jgi:uncharacterized phage protein (TIGR01671 family)
MRELKYYAWHKELKKMYQVRSIDWDYRYHVESIRVVGEVESFNVEEVELLEFIGRCDKNNQELYNGDIIRTQYWKDNSNFSYGEIIWHEDDAGFRVRWFGGVPTYGQYENIEVDFEKIGNKFQNPELLKDVVK